MKKTTIILATREDAEEIIENLIDTINQYGFATVSDLKGLSGICAQQYTDTKYGWADISNISIKRIPEGYELDLPEPGLLPEIRDVITIKIPNQLSNLIINMAIKGATEDEIGRTFRHSMSSYIDNGMASLEEKYKTKDPDLGPHTISNKEILQKIYANNIGKTIDYKGVWRGVKEVKITDQFIVIILEPVMTQKGDLK